MRNFVSKWLGETGPEPEPVAPSIAPGRRVYGIGDVHGRVDLLLELHRLIETDAAGYDGAKVLVYLGDYIDRGEYSKEVIDLLLETPLPGFETVCLLGNHEQTLLDFLQHPTAAAGWLNFGGRDTLRSYGVDPGSALMRADLDDLRDQLQERLPTHHLEFFNGCELIYVEGDYCFVHAGIRPGVALTDQRNDDLLWIRDDFTGSRQQHDHIVVHGHSITEEVAFHPNRIGIDTGAFYTGVLTALVLEGAERRLLQTGDNT